MLTKKPTSKLNELAKFYGMDRTVFLKALIEREHQYIYQNGIATEKKSRKKQHACSSQFACCCSI